MKNIRTLLVGAFCAISTLAIAVPPHPELIKDLIAKGDLERVEQLKKHDQQIRKMDKQTVARSSARRVAQSTDGTESLNIAPKGLLILANFADLSFRTSNNQAQMDSMLNGQSYNYDISIGSARKYFYDQSSGQYNPHFDVVGPVTLPQNMAYYGSNGSEGEGDDVKLGDMVLHACSLAYQIPGVNFADYDNNNDGELDFVYIIYAGYGEADGGDEETMWPASWDMESAVEGGYTSLPTNSGSRSYTYGGKTIGSFAYSSELNYYYSEYRPTRGYSASNPMRAGIGTFCHEFSHVIGLPDYYDTEYGTNSDEGRTPGDWSLMDGGSYNGCGEVPPCYSVYDKFFVGWATPTVLNSAQDVTLAAGDPGYYINQAGVTSTAMSRYKTYYLENRQQTGWDAYLPGHGLLVWQVQYDQTKWDDNTPNNTDRNPCITIVRSNGTSKNIGDASDPFPGTSGNKTSYTPITGYPLTNIAENGGVITFAFMGSSTGDNPGGNPGGSDTTDCYSWTASAELTTGTKTLENQQWTVAMTGSSYTGFDNNSDRGAQFGSSKSAASQVSLTTSFSQTIDQVVINATAAGGTTATLTVLIGGQQVGQQTVSDVSSAEYTFTNSNNLTGNLEIRLSGMTKAIFLKSISVCFQANTAIGNIETAQMAEKRIIDGQLYIFREGIIYDCRGMRVGEY